MVDGSRSDLDSRIKVDPELVSGVVLVLGSGMGRGTESEPRSGLGIGSQVEVEFWVLCFGSGLRVESQESGVILESQESGVILVVSSQSYENRNNLQLKAIEWTNMTNKSGKEKNNLKKHKSGKERPEPICSLCV